MMGHPSNDWGNMRETRQPALIVVTGRPGAGKTTLAQGLARAVRCPVVSRDEIKEGLVHTTGHDDASKNLQRHATETFFDVLALLLGRRISLVVEAAFQHNVWAPRLEPLRSVARVRIVLCEIDSECALARRAARTLGDPARVRIHPEGMGNNPPGSYDSPRLEVPTLRVNTSDGYEPAFDAILDFARG